MYYDERENKLNIIDKYKEKNIFESEENNTFESYLTNNDVKTWDTDVKLKIDNININNFRNTDNVSLFNTSDGFNKGNMFKNLYDPYKNYVYKVIVKGERDELLLKIQELTFKTIDLNLYLDLNKNNTNVYNEFKDTVNELKKYKDMYERKYGPLCMEETLYYDSYKWSENPWPWMNEGGKY